MDRKSVGELTSELSAEAYFVEAKIGLDTGRLLKSTTHVYFIAPRLGGWEVIEQSTLSDVSRTEKKSNFMGDTFVIHTKSGRWVCKEVTEDIDLRSWILQKARVTPRTSTSHFTNPVNQTSEWSETKDYARKSEWEPSTTSGSRQETNPTNFFSTHEEYIEKSLEGFDDSDLSNDEQRNMPEKLEAVFNRHTDRPTQSLQKPRERLQEVDDLLEKITSGEDEKSESGCGSALLKFFIFVWVFGFLADVCN